MAAMYSAANDGGMSSKKRSTRMTNLGFPGGSRTPTATSPGSWRPNGFMTTPPRGAGMEGRASGFTGTAGRGAGSEGMYPPNNLGSVTVGNATSRDLLPSSFRPRGNRNPMDLMNALTRLTQRQAPMQAPQAQVPVQNIGLPQGELQIALPDYESIRNLALQDYFAGLQGLMQ